MQRISRLAEQGPANLGDAIVDSHMRQPKLSTPSACHPERSEGSHSPGNEFATLILSMSLFPYTFDNLEREGIPRIFFDLAGQGPQIVYEWMSLSPP